MADRRKSPVEPEAIQPHMCSVDLRLEILSQVPFFAGLSLEEVSAINARFREQGFLPGEYIYFEEDRAEKLYVVAAGKVKLLRHTLSGKDVLLDILAPGEFFGSLSPLGEASYADTAQAQTEACVLGIGTGDFREVLETYPSVARRALEIVAERLQAAHEMVRQLSAYSAEQRIAYLLLKLGEKLGQKQPVGWLIQAPLSRDDLAQMAGTTTETASRVISQFQKDGLVDTGRQWIAITDRQGLAEIVGAGLG